MASSSSGDGSSTTGGRSEPAQQPELVPVTSTYTRANDIALRELLQAVVNIDMVGARKFVETLRETGLEAAVAAVACPNSKHFGPHHVAASTKTLGATVFFSIEGGTSEASEIYLIKTGADPEKANNWGCSWCPFISIHNDLHILQLVSLFGSLLEYMQTFMEVLLIDFTHTAMAFLMECGTNFLADFGGAAIGGVDPRDSSFWWNIQICSYTRWTVDSSVSANHNSLGALHLIRLCFSKGHSITPRLMSSNACSIIMSQIVKQSMLPIESTRPRNSVTVCFDGSIDEFKQSYRHGIEAIRLWCYANGKRVNLLKGYGRNLEVYTTPADGTFFLTLKYKGKYLVLSLAGRDLYFMGWRSEHGTFEFKPDSQTQQYMADDSCIILDIRKNYAFLSKDRKVGSTWMGPIALQQAFEVLYKCHGLVSDELKRSVGRFAVHFCEAARIQDVFNDSCSSFHFEVPELDSKNETNSYWVNNYDHLAEIAMQRADFVDKGQTLSPLDIPAVKVKSEIDIFKQLRILPRDAYKSGIFETENRKSPIYEGPLDDDSSGMESSNKRSRRERKERKKNERKGDPSKGGEDRGYPSFSLLEDWADSELEEADDQIYIMEEQKDDSDDDELEEEDDIKDTKKEQKDNLERNSEINDADREFQEYLDHFSAVKKIIDLKTRTQNLQPPIMIDRPPVRKHFDPYAVTKPKLKGLILSAGNIKLDFVTHFRKSQSPHLQTNGIFQRNILKVCSVMTRVLRFI